MLNKLKCLLILNRKKFNRKIDANDITMELIEELEKQGAIIIDVRSPQEFEEGHLRNAICIPDYEIMQKIEEVVPDKEQTIIVYCSSGYRSKKIQKKLENRGYTKLYNLYNGIENYWDFFLYMLK